MRLSELVYPSDLLVLHQFFHCTSIVKPIWSILPPKIICPEHACSKFMQLIHVPHIRCDNITIIYIFKNLYYVMSSTAITYRIYKAFFLLDCTQFNHLSKKQNWIVRVYPGEDSWGMDLSDSEKCKKFHVQNMDPEWRGMVFIKTGGVLAG